MKDSWNSESHATNESKPHVNGDAKDCQVRTKTAKNSAVDMMHRMSSSCLISALLYGRTADDSCGSAWIDCMPAIVLAIVLDRIEIAVAHKNNGWTCE